ncbi:MAG: type II toxin-antitoxin system VapC family toxin [Rickettsiales bacterium]
MKKLVIDASVAISLCLKDEGSTLTEDLLTELDNYQLLVPPHWSVEVANALFMAFRRKRLEFTEISVAFNLLMDLEPKIISLPYTAISANMFTLAEKHGLTIYDTYYLQVAINNSAILATLDKELHKAALNENIKIFE